MKHSEAIKLLFHGWQRQAETLSPEASGLYLLAISGLAEQDVAQAVRDFVSGRVDRQNRAFLPTSDEFGDYVRKIRNRRLDDEARSKPRLRPPPLNSSPEEIEKRRAFIASVVTPAVNQMRTIDRVSQQEHDAAVRRTIAEAIGVDAATLADMIASLPDRPAKAKTPQRHEVQPS